MERKKQRNWMLAVMLVIAVTFSNVRPVSAAELPDQTALVKGSEAKNEKKVDYTEIHDEDKVEMVTEASTPSNAQKPEAEEDLEEEDLSDDFEEEELYDDLEEEDHDNLEQDIKEEENHDTIQEELDEAAKDKTLEDEKSEDLVWVWSDKAPALMEAEEGEDLTSQFFGLSRASGICPTYEDAYEAMISMQDEYYEGMRWTNFEPYGNGDEAYKGKYYRFQGGSVKGASLGVGCAAFVFELSDKAFGDLPARTIDKEDSGMKT